MLDQREQTEQESPEQPSIEPTPPSKPKWRSRILLAGGAMVLFLVAIGGGALLGGRVSAGVGNEVEFPDWVYSSALSVDGYKAAVQMGESFTSLPCYCDCAEASGHKSLRDCYFKEDGAFNDHASACDVCGKEAVDALKWHTSGLSIKEIRKNIDSKYHDYGNPTDTPLPT